MKEQGFPSTFYTARARAIVGFEGFHCIGMKLNWIENLDLSCSDLLLLGLASKKISIGKKKVII